MQPPAQAAEQKRVDTDYTLLRRGPHSFVLGTAYDGWTVDVQQDAVESYRWGRVFGDLNECLSVHEDGRRRKRPGGRDLRPPEPHHAGVPVLQRDRRAVPTAVPTSPSPRTRRHAQPTTVSTASDRATCGRGGTPLDPALR